MSENPQIVSRVIRFGAFDADLQAQELRKHGVRLRLPGQSFLVLKLLLGCPGELVTREELQKAIWPSDTFVDFDHGLSAAVNRLREALGDSADEPKFVETLPRRGYRFIGEITATFPAPQVSDISPSRSAPATPGAVEAETKAPTALSRRRWIVPLAAAALTALVIGLGFWKWPHRSQPLAFNPVPFTTLPGWACCPAVSPDGRRVAFQWSGKRETDSKGVDLYVKSIGSEDLLRLTYDSLTQFAPTWSPDGSQIAFQQLANGEGSIYVISAKGGDKKKLHSTHASFGPSMTISWSPDGKQIAFADSPAGGGQKRLHLLNLATLESSQIEHDDRCEEELGPAFSRDGTQLAYACLGSLSDFAFAVATSSGASPRIIQQFSGFPEGFDWSAGGKSLIFSDGAALRELSVADGTSRAVAIIPGVGSLAIPAQGNRLVYDTKSGGNNNIWRADLLHPDAPSVELISTTRDQLGPQYSPDGKHIAFASDRGGPGEIWMSDSEGANLVQLSNLKNRSAGAPSWSPDGTKIVFDWRTRNPDHVALYIVDIAERIPRKLEVSTGDAAVPFWSHDGKWIYFLGGADEVRGERIYRVPPQGGRAQPVTSARGYFPQESLDGQSLYFATHSNPATLEVASLNPTGTEFPVPSVPPLSFVFNWTVVRDGIFFFPANDFKALSFYNYSTKQTHAVLKTNGGVFFGVSVSPDGRYIVYAQIDEARSDIMLINDFR